MRAGIRWVMNALTAIGTLACVAAVGYALGVFGGATPIRVGNADPDTGHPDACAAGDKHGAADMADDLRTSDGLRIRVRTPANYDPTRGYPLLVVYPPAGMDRATSERYYGLTPEATRRGFIVVYSDHVRLSRTAIRMQAKVARTVMDRWCIDQTAVSFIGHSDGGSIAQSVLISPQTGAVLPHAIVASAAGIQGKDLDSLCRSVPFRLRIVHSREDERFPGFGLEVARKWAALEGCEPELPAPDASGCATFRHCDTGSRIDYCETSGPHAQWPRVAAASFDFLAR